ncbi:MAG TPA: Ldh family oxidoreductase, partial [Acidimicrobiales bacterium]|nr:Ldh family oxidoreductase [Acidimicrobiales bacterium]
MSVTNEQAQQARIADVEAPHFSEEELVETATDVLHGLGTPRQTAEVVAASLALSNLVGHDSHGIVRLIQYSESVKSGQVRPDGTPKVVSARGAVATVDGGWGFGQPAAQLATQLATDAASAHGIAAVAISACNHIGRLGEYVATIAEAGQMGMAFCNSGPIVAPFGGAGRVMGTNPFAWSAPLRDDFVALDFATSKVAEGKIKIAVAEGRTLPPGLTLGARLVLVPYAVAWEALEARTMAGVEGTFVHPFDDHNFIAGHATMGLEILEDAPDTAAVITAIGGG